MFIEVALNTELFVSIADQSMTVVGVHTSYIKPLTTNTLMLSSGQITDVLITNNKLPAGYYIAARDHSSAQGVPFDNTALHHFGLHMQIQSITFPNLLLHHTSTTHKPKY